MIEISVLTTKHNLLKKAKTLMEGTRAYHHERITQIR